MKAYFTDLLHTKTVQSLRRGLNAWGQVFRIRGAGIEDAMWGNIITSCCKLEATEKATYTASWSPAETASRPSCTTGTSAGMSARIGSRISGTPGKQTG